MKTFLAGVVVGLILGLLLGAAGMAGVRAAKASNPVQPIELRIPDEPAPDAGSLSAFLDSQPFDVGYCARDLRTGKVLARAADRTVCLASIMKLFCLTELYRRVDADGLDPGRQIDVPGRGPLSLEAAADLMIGLSDNAATDALAEFLGREHIDQLAGTLGLEGLSPEILPSSSELRDALDRRIKGDQISIEGLPQHGTARAVAEYLEMLAGRQVVNAAVSDQILSFLARHPKPFSRHYADRCNFSGKGGNILWTRPPRHFSMMGWGLLVKNESDPPTVLCVWGEWFPETMPPDQQSEFLIYVTDSILSSLRHQGT